MKIKDAKFFRPLTTNPQENEEFLPIIAFMGRSNVGKSSLLNSITGNKKLSHTGSRPGVTQQINLFEINKNFLIADLPGYGYAKLGKHQRKELNQLIFWFLESPNLPIIQIYLLIDSRTGATQQDIELINYIIKLGRPLNLVLTKIDKLKAPELKKALNQLRQDFPILNIFTHSSKTNAGKKEIINSFSSL